VATNTLEREIKFSVGPAFDLPDFPNMVARAVRQSEQTFATTYFDTPDLRLWSRGITLRFRSGRGGGAGTWTVKLPERDGGPTLNRREISWPGVKDEVPASAGALLRGLIRRADLDLIVQMETTRLPWILLDHAGHEWAELQYDDVTVTGGGQDGLRFRQIEIERTGDQANDRAISSMAQTLRRAGAKPDAEPKVAKALGLSSEGGRGSAPRLGPKSTAADVVRHAISAGLDRLLDHDYRLRLYAKDPEVVDVHQARVATRRLRSDLKTLRSLLDPIWLGHTEDELRWMGGILGSVRDADVLEVSLGPARKRKMRLAGSQSLAELRNQLAAERDDAVADLGEALRSKRYLDLLDRLHAAASQPPLTRGSDRGPKPLGAAEMLPNAVNRRWRTLKKRVAAAGRSPSEKQLHRIRIGAKNVRYACELSQPVIGKPAGKTAKLAENIQTALGDHHDASAAIDWLTQQAGQVGAGGRGFAAGVLTTEQDRRRRKLGKKWWRQWAKLSRPSARRWLG
jgi:CHAD domain-containing protein